MRKKQRLKTSVFDHYVEHEIGTELKNISMILDQAREIGIDFEYHDHHHIAKKRARSIIYTRGKNKKKVLYRDRVDYTEKTLQYVSNAKIVGHANLSFEWPCWCREVDPYLPLIHQVIDQATRHVFDGEKVPASEK
jgi:hypothetical protein